jgi:hypothetical protein
MTRTEPLIATGVKLNRLFINSNSPLSSESEINLPILNSPGNLFSIEADL